MGRSKLQEDVGRLLRTIFPYNVIKEEFHVGEGLMLDFLIIRSHGVDYGIEVQGKQHYLPNAFFHKDEDGWVTQQMNDAKKKELCVQHNIVLIEFKYNDTLTRQVLFDKINMALDEFTFSDDQPIDPYAGIKKIANELRKEEMKKTRLRMKKYKRGGEHESN